jgi:hypothetical protein
LCLLILNEAKLLVVIIEERKWAQHNKHIFRNNLLFGIQEWCSQRCLYESERASNYKSESKVKMPKS